MLTSRDVVNTAFAPKQFQGGYDEREVDGFLDEVVRTLRYYEQGGRPGPQAPSSPKHDQNFASTKFRRGYDQQEVDKFLEDVIETLRYYERGGRPDPQTLVTPAGADSEGLGQRALRWLRGDSR